MDDSIKKVVIIGGGVGGLQLATNLGNTFKKKKEIEVTLVDCNLSHIWKPLLHKVATGSINRDINVISYISHAYKNNFNFKLGNVVSLDRKNKKIVLNKSKGKILKKFFFELSYDILVISVGGISNDFNVPGVKDYCFFLDKEKDAEIIHEKILDIFVMFSLLSKDLKTINIAIVGAGATGVELSSELHYFFKNFSIYKFKRNINLILNIILIESGDRILPSLPSNISILVLSEILNLGIKVLTKTTIIKVDSKGLYTKQGEYIQADLIIWSAGIKAPTFLKKFSELETNHINQLIIKPTLQTTLDEKIFAIGDCASCKLSGIFIPPRAQSAHQMALHVKKNILALINGKPIKSYVYKDYGSLISLSQSNTIGIVLNNFTGKFIIIKGLIAKIICASLYRMHQIFLFGYIKTGLIILLDKINRIIKTNNKLY